MATRSSILAWKIPWTEELVGYSSRGLQRVGTADQLSTEGEVLRAEETAGKQGIESL